MTWFFKSTLCCPNPRSHGGDRQGMRSLKGKSIWQVISCTVHLWTIPSLPQINLHKRNEKENVWSLTTSFVLHLCLESSPLGAKCTFQPKFTMCAYICYLVHDSVQMLGWCIFRVWVQEFRQHTCVYTYQHMTERTAFLPQLNIQIFKSEVCNSAQAQRGRQIGNINWFKMHTIHCVSIHLTHMHDCSRITVARQRVSVSRAFSLSLSESIFLDKSGTLLQKLNVV